MPASLLVFRSVTRKDRFFGSNASVNSGIGRISFSLKYGAYFPTLSFSYSLADFFWIDQELGIISGCFFFCPGWMMGDFRAGHCVLAPAYLFRARGSLSDEKRSFCDVDSSIVA